MFQPQQTLLRVLFLHPLSPPTKFQLLDIFSGWTFKHNIETLPSESNLRVDSVCYSDNKFSVLAVHDFLSDGGDCVMVQTQDPSATPWVPLWLSLALINMPILIWTWEQITLVSIFFPFFECFLGCRFNLMTQREAGFLSSRTVWCFQLLLSTIMDQREALSQTSSLV